MPPILLLIIILLNPTQSKSTQCRTSCGQIPIAYPFGIDDGCGSPYYRHILLCTDSNELHLRTPSGTYPITNITYSDPHILVSNPFQWSCRDEDNFRPVRPFSLDTSTHFRLSPHNDYLFFNCSHDDVIMEPKPMFCQRFPDECDSACDTSSHLCRHLPGCPSALRGSSCCAYSPKGSASLRMMLQHCKSYTTVYWRNVAGNEMMTPVYEQVPEYGIRVDFDVPVTTRCLTCQDSARGGGGTCGFDTTTQEFLCLCGKGNSTTLCKDENGGRRRGVVAGTVTALSVAGVFAGTGVWYLKKMRKKAPITHGVQSNENRLF